MNVLSKIKKKQVITGKKLILICFSYRKEVKEMQKREQETSKSNN